MRKTGGFTLIELAISLAIVALLLGMLVVPLNTQLDQQRINDTQKQLVLINESLMGFAAATGRLPCPALVSTASTVAGAGTENKPGANCAAAEGVLPWATLGMPELDAWGRRFTYRVTAEFANDAAGGAQATFTLADSGGITVVSTAGGVNLATNIVAAVVSHGKNGAGAYLPSGLRIALGTGDELENSNGDGTFVSKVPDPNFDDLVAWISPNTLKSRMIAANRLP